ncbi:MAG: hypothetical protein ACREQW_14205 [Candidatus Binatia bacterium]
MKIVKEFGSVTLLGLILGFVLSPSPAASETIEEVYKKALKEGGFELLLYARSDLCHGWPDTSPSKGRTH